MTTMEKHNQAMEMAEKADREKRLGRIQEAEKFFSTAFELESQAAQTFLNRPNLEPTRSIFFRSAASLALECGRLREAEQMIAEGLAGTPPEEIAEELRDLYEQVNFNRHLKLRGVELEQNEIQLSISGPSTGLGMAPSREVRERIDKAEIIAIRTIERIMNRPFRNSGRVPREITEQFECYESVARAGSYAVTIRLAKPQQWMPGFDRGEEVTTEVFECLELLNNQEDKLLKERIPDPDYYSNFVSLAKQMAPDGKRVSQVGFTLQKSGKQKTVTLNRTKNDWSILLKARVLEMEKGTFKEEGQVTISGVLRYADSTQKKHGLIEVVDGGNAIHKIRVPLGMMADIVRPLYEFSVIIAGKRNDRGIILLEEIEKMDDE